MKTGVVSEIDTQFVPETTTTPIKVTSVICKSVSSIQHFKKQKQQKKKERPWNESESHKSVCGCVGSFLFQ